MSAKWCRNAGFWCSTATGLSLNGNLLRSRDIGVVISFPGDLRRLLEIEGGRRRSGLPLQTGSAPGVLVGNFAVAHRPQEIDHGQQITYGQNRRACCREHV